MLINVCASRSVVTFVAGSPLTCAFSQDANRRVPSSHHFDDCADLRSVALCLCALCKPYVQAVAAAALRGSPERGNPRLVGLTGCTGGRGGVSVMYCASSSRFRCRTMPCRGGGSMWLYDNEDDDGRRRVSMCAPMCAGRSRVRFFPSTETQRCVLCSNVSSIQVAVRPHRKCSNTPPLPCLP